LSRSSRRPGWVGCHAGLTERTSFRHYADKREVLFAGSVDVQERFVLAVAGALKSAAPIDALAVGLMRCPSCSPTTATSRAVDRL
jgi:hypothetical protein